MNQAQKFTTLRCFMPKTAGYEQSQAGGNLRDNGAHAFPSLKFPPTLKLFIPGGFGHKTV